MRSVFISLAIIVVVLAAIVAASAAILVSADRYDELTRPQITGLR